MFIAPLSYLSGLRLPQLPYASCEAPRTHDLYIQQHLSQLIMLITAVSLTFTHAVTIRDKVKGESLSKI